MSYGAPELATKEYWDDRYRGPDKNGYDWFKNYSDIKTIVEVHLRPDSKILILGCGTSSLSEDLYLSGFKHVTSVDFSAPAIELMRQRNQSRPEMSFHLMDIQDLEFSDCTFDVAIDKGTMDALLCYKGSPWDPPQDVVEACAKEVREAIRVLVPDGVFLMLSFRPSHFLKPRLKSDQWQDDPVIQQFGDFYSFVVARKKSATDATSIQNTGTIE